MIDVTVTLGSSSVARAGMPGLVLMLMDTGHVMTGGGTTHGNDVSPSYVSVCPPQSTPASSPFCTPSLAVGIHTQYRNRSCAAQFVLTPSSIHPAMVDGARALVVPVVTTKPAVLTVQPWQ